MTNDIFIILSFQDYRFLKETGQGARLTALKQFLGKNHSDDACSGEPQTKDSKADQAEDQGIGSDQKCGQNQAEK